MNQFPEFIWDQQSKTLIVSKTGEAVINPGEYINGPMTFNDMNAAQQFLTEYNISGNIGIKLTKQPAHCIL
jgi:hypothetical protein